MSELILVRHGQASFGTDNYDRLSDKGVEQVKILSRHWRDLGLSFDAIYCGSLLRQQQTAAELLPLVQTGQVVTNASLNEYNGDPLIQVYLRKYALADGFPKDLQWPIRDEKQFQKLFEAATSRWIENTLEPDASDEKFEYWQDFQRRVYQVIDTIMAKHDRGSKILLSTSGGVIAMALQRVLQFSDAQVIATNWMVHNSSVTKFRYGNGRVSLSQFNNIAHLESPALQSMVTYR
ncbi:MAG: hypothetical protein COC19_00400 [SAR86 cluster bacterium]|uniref:Histidine phosphatase family protein n=1 Tax=SAR86 cluster bacterium TaxID=2030880 RepID=A0A2A4MV33_9GAMM|nr:MAG: hypothetical protein COC19_00400 [SAR86 cluster bacterium]